MNERESKVLDEKIAANQRQLIEIDRTEMKLRETKLVLKSATAALISFRKASEDIRTDSEG